MSHRLCLLAVCGVILAAASTAAAQAQFKQYESPYYIIHTDLNLEDARETYIRTARLVEEYQARTRGFAGQLNQKLPLYLYRDPADYYQAGGPRDSVGVFMGERLMVIAGSRADADTWHVVQHEAFHQFAFFVMGGNLPIWVNEGLGEYFGEGLFTGDGMVTGLIPPERLLRLQQEIRIGLPPLAAIMQLSHEEWNDTSTPITYDQAWSMVQFLAHGDGGKYQQAFAAFINARGRARAWEDSFGATPEQFEQRWREYWLGLKPDATADLYIKATVATLTSHLARAVSQKQSFPDFDAFLAAAAAGQLKAHPEDWLPPSLLKDVVDVPAAVGAWSLESGADKLPRLVCVLDDKTRFVGSYAIANGRVRGVTVQAASPQAAPAAPQRRAPVVPATGRAPLPAGSPAMQPATRSSVRIDPVASAVSLARAYVQSGNPAKARDVLERALKDNPASPLADDARKALKDLQQPASTGH